MLYMGEERLGFLQDILAAPAGYKDGKLSKKLSAMRELLALVNILRRAVSESWVTVRTLNCLINLSNLYKAVPSSISVLFEWLEQDSLSE
jgi:hypothetical protein